MMLFEVGDEVRVRQPTNLFHSELGKVVSIDHVKLTYKVVFHRGGSDVYTCFDLILVKRQEETSMKFKVGDKVKVSGSWRGNSGKVGTISRTDWGVMYKYRVEFEDADPESFKEEELESVKEEEKVMKFKVGDKVKILNTEFGNQGRVGTITTISGTVMIYLVEIVGAFGKDCQWSNASDLELVTEHEGVVVKFKVGDRVQVVAQYSAFYGDKGTVIENDGTDNLPIHVNFDVGGHVCWLYENDLKVLHEEEKVMEFKVGDKVRMIRNTYGHRGKIGTLEKIDTSTMPYCVVFDDGRKEWCYGNEFKLLKEEKVMTFKVGDKVKVKDSWFGHDGQVGVVLDTDNYEPYNYNIKFDTEGDNGRRDENFMGDSLELVTEEEEKVMKFKVGDKVKVKDSWFGFTGEVGLIVRIDDPANYPYRVKFDVVDEEDEEVFAEGSLELVKEKDNYPTLKQAYKSLLEIQKELTTLEESMMRTVRHTRTEIARNYEELAELESKILEAAKQ